MGPDITHHPLTRADGSATFSTPLFTALAAVNGPIEVQRRDELPDQATIEINIRPATGVGGPRERWLETLVKGVVGSVVLTHLHPRTLVQITLQITKEPGMKLRRAVRDVAVLPTLVNAAFLALVDGSIPLAAGLSAVLVAAREGDVLCDPSDRALVECESVHALAFTSRGQMIMDEAAGGFGVEVWEDVAKEARESCLAAFKQEEDESMVGGEVEEEVPWLRAELEERAREGSAWRDAS